MKFILSTILTAIISTSAFAQAKPIHTQYILNNFIANPAIAGIENYTDVKASYRNQWVGIEGNPVTTYFSVHAPINKGDLRTNITSFEIPGENPRGKGYWKDYEVSPKHSGIGFMAMNDRAGYLNRWSVNASYAYHIPLTPNTALSAGFSAGVTSTTLDRSKIVWANLDPNDPAIGYNNGELSKLRPELGGGLYLYSKNYFAGLSVLSIVPGGKNRFTTAERYGENYSPNFYATGGFRTFINDELSVLPSVMIQYWQPQLTSVHTNVKLQYLDKFWFGASYRFASLVGGFSGMAGINVSNTFNISYAYEQVSNSRLNTYTKGSHEIMVGFIMGNRYGDSCPRNIW